MFRPQRIAVRQGGLGVAEFEQDFSLEKPLLVKGAVAENAKACVILV